MVHNDKTPKNNLITWSNMLLLFLKSDVVDRGLCNGMRLDTDDGLNVCAKVLSLSSSAFSKFWIMKREIKSPHTSPKHHHETYF